MGDKLKVKVGIGVNIAVFCSGNGSNFQAIIDASKKGIFRANIALMVCDNPGAYAIERAKKESIKTLLLDQKNFPSKKDFENRIIEELEKENIGLICLAGYMRMLSPAFVARYRNSILNVHPALLPSFKGTHGIKDAIDNGVRITGVTVHFVNEEMDSGPIILQEPVEIAHDDTEKTLEEKIHRVEHRLYPQAIKLATEGKVKVLGKKVKVLIAVAALFLIFGFKPNAMVGGDIVTPALLPPVSLNYKYDNRLGLLSFNLYDINEIVSEGKGYKKAVLNKNADIEMELTKEQLEDMKIKGSIKAARIFTEMMDSLNAVFVRDGIEKLIDITTKAVDFREDMGKKYYLHFKADEDEALLRYKRNF